MKKHNLGWFALALLLAAAVTWAGVANKAAVFDGIVESTSGGFMFPDASVQTSAMVDTDTTCDGQACDGTNFTNVTAAAGPGLSLVDSLDQTIGPVLDMSTSPTSVRTFLELGASQEPVFFNIEPPQPRYILAPFGGPVRFSGLSCTGDVHMETNSANFLPFLDTAYAFGGHGVIYQTDKSEGAVAIDAQSQYVPQMQWLFGDFNPANCEDVFWQGNARPATLFADISTLYVPPFRIE